MTPTPWEIWASGVLQGIGAPVDATNVDTLWAWSNAETAPYYLMRWNNPLNTTQPWPGALDSGAQPGPHDVKIYASLADGINATVVTLLNGYYPNIVANLRSSIPRQQWGQYSSAGAQLHAWGTGTNWLTSTYGAVPGNLTPDPSPINLELTMGGTVIMAADSINLLVRGTNHHLRQRRFDGVAWSEWRDLEGDLGSSAITAVRRQNGDIHVYVVGNVGAVIFEIISTDDGVTWGPYIATGGAGDGLIAVGSSPAPGTAELPESEPKTIIGTFTGTVGT